MDGVGLTSMSNTKISEGATLNSPTKIIIKKENIGLEEHQHQSYQYSLFNNNAKRDKFYEDLTKVKDRLEKAGPNMQQVIQLDMKRVHTNKIYERQLSRDLSGPRGLDWQCKQTMHRLANSEREAERELIRLNLDLRKASVTCLNTQRTPTPNFIREHYRTRASTLSVTPEPNSSFQNFQKSDFLLRRTFTISTNPANIDRLTAIPRKRSSTNHRNSLFIPVTRLYKPIDSKTNETKPQLEKHAQFIYQQRREVEQKLREFLN